MAPTFRARLGFQTGTFLNLQLLVEGEGVVHLGDTELGRQPLGSEVDAELTARLGEHFSLTATYADYDGDGGFASQQKFWLQLDVAY